MTVSPNVWALSSLGAAAALVAGVLAVGPAGAAGESFGVGILRVDETSMDVSFCLTAGTALPAQATGTYNVGQSGATVASGTWWSTGGTELVTGTSSCPAPMSVITINGLHASTTYTVTAQVALVPYVEDDNGQVSADGSRSTVTLVAEATVTTAAASPPEPDDTASPGPSASVTGSATGSPTATASETSTAAPPAAPTTAPTVSSPVIPDPAAFRPAQMLLLTPRQVASIDPRTLGQLPSSVFAVIRPAQAAALTREQVGAVRPARAGAMRPASVAAIAPSALSALRPAGVSALAPATVARLTRAQLSALTARQVAALKPAQRAALTSDELALLRGRSGGRG